MPAPIAYSYARSDHGRFVYVAANLRVHDAGRGIVKFGEGANWRERLTALRNGFRAARQTDECFVTRWYGEPGEWRFATVLWVNSELAAQHIASLARARALSIEGTAPLGLDYAYDISIAEGFAALRWATQRVRRLGHAEGFRLKVRRVADCELGDCLLVA